MVQDLKSPISNKDEMVTLYQALVWCRSKTKIDCLLFSAIILVSRTREFIKIYHGNYKLKAQLVIDNLALLCREHFHLEANVWITDEICAQLGDFGNDLTTASWAWLLVNGGALEYSCSLDSASNSDAKNNSGEKPIFILSHMFQLNLLKKEPLARTTTIL